MPTPKPQPAKKPTGFIGLQALPGRGCTKASFGGLFPPPNIMKSGKKRGELRFPPRGRLSILCPSYIYPEILLKPNFGGR